jgi:hypothetical protein
MQPAVYRLRGSADRIRHCSGGPVIHQSIEGVRRIDSGNAGIAYDCVGLEIELTLPVLSSHRDNRGLTRESAYWQHEGNCSTDFLYHDERAILRMFAFALIK